MDADLISHFEGTDGSTISTSNPSGPNPFSGVTSTPVLDDDLLLDGEQTMFIASGSAARNAFWTLPDGSPDGDGQNDLSISFLFYATNTPPGATCQVLQGRDDAGGRVFDLAITGPTNGRLVARNSSDSTINTGSPGGTNVSGHAIADATPYQIDVSFGFGTGTTDGFLAYTIYNMSSGWTGTPITTPWSNTAVLLDNPIKTLYFGPNASGDRASDWWFGRPRVAYGTTTQFGEYVASTPSAWYAKTGGILVPLELFAPTSA